MKRKRIIPAILTAVLLVVTSLGFTATAASADDEDKPKSVVIHPGCSITLSKGKSRQLEYTIRPESATVDTEVDWYSEDPNIVEVDQSGQITAVSAGVTWIHIRTANRKAHSLKVTVPGRYQSGPDEDPSRQDDDPSYTRDYADDEDIPIVKISTAQLVEAAIAAGGGAVTVENYSSVSCSALQEVTYDTKNPINFDTKFANGGVQGRVTINPKDYAGKSGDIKVGVYTSEARTGTVQRTFARYYSNKVLVIRCAQNQFGSTVGIAVKSGGLSTGNLHFYSYNRSDNAISDLSVSDVRIDNSGYLHFNTKTGGYIIVSEGPLTKV